METRPRVLVVSNNGFSLSNSNGRTLGLLFKGWPKDRLAQFCFNTDGPLWDVCNNYFCVSDADALWSLFHLHPVSRNDLTGRKEDGKTTRLQIPRTALFSILRHLVWELGVWRGKCFYSWLDSFSPEVVMIQSGDTAFPHNLARRIARRYNAKLVFFNTEGIYYLKKNYFYPGILDGFFFPLYNYIFKKAYSRAMNSASFCFYLHEQIQQDNDRCFNVPSCVIYTSSSLDPSDKPFNVSHPVFSYFGNFAFNRGDAIIEIASFLQEVNKAFCINVYGKATPELEDKFNLMEGINYHGFLPYSQIQDIIKESDILLHVESHDERYAENLRYGFSTKIADCLASGRSFILYSPSDIACFKYIQRNKCAWATSDKSSFINAVNSIINNSEERDTRIKIAKEVAKRNHCLDKNVSRFQSMLSEVCHKRN